MSHTHDNVKGVQTNEMSTSPAIAKHRDIEQTHPIFDLQNQMGNQRMLNRIQGCSLFPQRCPTGGACHLCQTSNESSLQDSIQPKLRIGQPNDKYEQEADRVAEQVMRMPEPKIQKKSNCPLEDSSCSEGYMEEDMVQRQEEEEEEPGEPPEEEVPEEEEEEETSIQPKSENGQATHVNPGLQEQIQSMKGGGQPLPREVRNFFEPRFGYDFSDVQVHLDANAAELARVINAQAFTIGQNILFNSGQYIPETSTGKRLLAHELTHVIQQNRGTQKKIQRQGGIPQPPLWVRFSSSDPVHVPSCGPFRARTNVHRVTWSLLRDPTAVDAGTTIDRRGRITIGANQAAGQIRARAENAAGYAYAPFRIRSHPTGISRTFIVNAATSPSEYGAVFDHVFISNDGNVASLEGVRVGERFHGVPNPAAAIHNIVYPLNPFGGVFRLRTSMLNLVDAWSLTRTGELGGTHDSVTSERAGINVGHFIQSTSRPRPLRSLPADMTLIQTLYWYCPQAGPRRRWRRFMGVAHSRTLRHRGGNLEFVTTVNGLEHIDTYTGPIGVFNVNAIPISTPRSPAPPANARIVNITADTLPSALPAGQSLNFRIIRPNRGCTIAANPANNHAAILTVGRRPGRVIVEVADITNRNRDRVTVTIT